MTARIGYYLYDLRFNDSRKTRAQGALLKYDFRDGATGFASLSAWPEAGDRTLAEKLQSLRSNPQLEPQWTWACLDARLRQNNQAALPAGTRLPDSHWHLRSADLIDPNRWSDLVASRHLCWKLKVTPSILAVLPLGELADFARSNSVKLRLDANGSFTSLEQLNLLFEALGHVDMIDFFEDPAKDESLWKELKQVWRVPLASDWIRPSHFDCDLSIYKPSRDPDVDEQRDFVITTAFDHPLGLNYTAYRSMELKDHPRLRKPLGISHPGLYSCEGIDSQVTLGEIGFGWGELLEKLSWEPL